MKLLAEGAASEILDLGGGRVLRRFKRDGDPEGEARIMEYARIHGYPVPRVFEVREDGLVLERVDGPNMAEDVLRRHPWRFAAYARVLARLHEQLHRIRGPAGAPIVHLDLHPKNVLMSVGGPVVVDWSNAQEGRPEMDTALTWVILMTSSGRAGRLFARLFERHADVRSGQREAVAFRLADRNVSETERDAVRRLLS